MGETVRLSKDAGSHRAGEVIAGKYRLERELGRGAMGTVWAAQHLTLGQRVAIKFIGAEHAQSPEARLRFRTEARAAARLKSRHVVQVYDDGQSMDGTPYIVMEYLEGETLEARLEREREIPLLDAIRITAHVARGLARAHARGIVHRDLKPANIFLARNDEDELGWTTKVLDFGIAKIDDTTALSTTKTGALLGTPLFMSPEQVRGAHQADARSDLYSLGLCFYNMVSGRFAFDGESFGDILIAICTNPLPDLRRAVPSVPAELGAWFERCCAREPESRFQSADELLDALQSAMGSSAALLQRGSVPEEHRGPSGTLRGHAAPLGPTTALLSTDDSGPFAPAALPDKRRSGEFSAASVLTVRDAPNPTPPPPRRRLATALAASTLAVAALVIVGRFSTGSTRSLSNERAPAVTSAPAAPAAPTELPAPSAPTLPSGSAAVAPQPPASTSTDSTRERAASARRAPVKPARTRAPSAPTSTAAHRARDSAPDLGF